MSVMKTITAQPVKDNVQLVLGYLAIKADVKNLQCKVHPRQIVDATQTEQVSVIKMC